MVIKQKLTTFFLSLGNEQDRQQSSAQVFLQPRDGQSFQVGGDVNLQCTVYGDVERPYEFTYTKDGQPLGNSKNKLIYLIIQLSIFSSNRCWSTSRWFINYS